MKMMNDDRKAILEAIEHAVGVTEAQMQSRERTQVFVFARIIYAHHRYGQVSDIYRVAEELKRGRNVIDYYLEKYRQDFEFCPRFKHYAKEVEGRLKYDKV